jgi:hypothetical protein
MRIQAPPKTIPACSRPTLELLGLVRIRCLSVLLAPIVVEWICGAGGTPCFRVPWTEISLCFDDKCCCHGVALPTVFNIFVSRYWNGCVRDTDSTWGIMLSPNDGFFLSSC